MLSFFMMAGVSYLFYFFSLWPGVDSIRHYLPWLILIFSFPHFMATYWVWSSRVKNWKSEWWSLGFPVFYVSLFFMASKGWLFSEAVETILKLSYLYLLYHFAQQLYGVTLWINYRQGVQYIGWRKLLLRGFFLSAGLYAWVEMELRGVVNVLFYHQVPSWNIHSDYIQGIFFIVLSLSFIIFILTFMDFIRYKSLKYFMPLGSMGLAWLWFLPPLNQGMVVFLPILHGIQYLPFIHMKGGNLSLKKWCFLTGFFVASGWLFFRWVPFQVTGPLEGTLWPAMILTLLNNHHFIIDGRIWKLRDPQNQDLLTVKA